MDHPQPFKAVRDFCRQEDDLYWDIIEELQMSIEYLSKTVNSDPDLEPLKFIRHKMKSTFRILKDDDFRILLDNYVEHIENSNPEGVKNGMELISATCKTYQDLLKIELNNKP